jgi:CHAT domain-containing protein
LLDRGETERAFEFVERAKSRALVDALAGGLDIRVRPGSPEQSRLVDELNRLRREHDLLVEQADGLLELRDLEGRISSLLEELRLAGANDLERMSLLQATVYSPRDQLDANTALVEYYFVGEDLVVFVVDSEHIRAKRVAGGLSSVGRLLPTLKMNLDAAAAAPERRAALEMNARVLLQRLFDTLLAPVSEWLGAYDRLIFVPHGLLHQVPFAALHDGQQYLVERFEAVVAPSASSLTFCLRPRSRTDTRALIVAHSAGGALPGAIAEAESVAALFDGDHLFEDQVTLPALREHARQADLIHIAAHGVSRLDAPLFSYLRIAGGHLTALDCFDLELDCSLVALSACESGRGVVDAGDEQIGLPRAFLYAGARAVLYSLWRIDDRTTQTLMESFYARLRRGLGRGAALRAAQLECLQGDAVHPFLWAAMVLVGDWR